MHSVRAIQSVTREDLERIVPGYVSTARFEVKAAVSETEANFSVVRKDLAQPFVKKHDYSDPSVLAHYREVAAQGCSYGAFVGGKLAGFILGEIQSWNATMVIREFGVASEYHRRGIGSALLAQALAAAQEKGLRGALCETQSTNVPAILLYRKMGFTIQGLDLALYSNDDLERGEVALFLRKSLGKQ